MTEAQRCVLCEQPGGELVTAARSWRVILADDADSLMFPGFTRVIWQEHRREMTDLTPAGRSELMEVVFAVEALMLEHLQPDKINLASLGNQVDHLHWHVIPRWRADSHFPRPVWASAQTGRSPFRLEPERLERYCKALQDGLAPFVGRDSR